VAPRQRGISTTIVALVIIAAIIVAVGAGYFTSTAGQHTNCVPGPCPPGGGGGSFYFTISINYGGPWNLVIWGKNATGQQNLNFTRSLNGSGNYKTTVITELSGYAEDTVCTKATKLDSQSLALTLDVNGETNSTTAYNPAAKICQTWAV
jgi:hypothetical protein